MIRSLAIYFFYDESSIVDEYIYYYLKHLLTCFDEICFVSNSKISANDFKKLSKYCKKIIIRNNYGFDAWAYKEALESYGYNLIKKLDKLLLNNFTCYGPIYSFKNMFANASKMDCDFWGHCEYRTESPTIINNNVILPHLMSYFICFNHSLLKTDDFKLYWDNLPIINNYWDSVVLHESKLTNFFFNRGFKYFSYIPIEHYELQSRGNLVVYDAYSLLLLDMNPLLKRKVFELNSTNTNWKWRQATHIDPFEILLFIKKFTDYPVKLIIDNLRRTYMKNSKDFLKKINKII